MSSLIIGASIDAWDLGSSVHLPAMNLSLSDMATEQTSVLVSIESMYI